MFANVGERSSILVSETDTNKMDGDSPHARSAFRSFDNPIESPTSLIVKLELGNDKKRLIESVVEVRRGRMTGRTP